MTVHMATVAATTATTAIATIATITMTVITNTMATTVPIAIKKPEKNMTTSIAIIAIHS